MRERILVAGTAAGLILASLAIGQEPPSNQNRAVAAALGAPIPTEPQSTAAVQQPNAGQPKLPSANEGDSILPPALRNSFTDSAAPSRMWVDLDYLLWLGKSSPSPALAISGSSPVTLTAGPTTTTHIPTSPGFIGLTTQANTYGLSAGNSAGIRFGKDIESPLASGTRLEFGDWFDSDQTIGGEMRGFYLGKTWGAFGAGPGGGILAVPYQNAATGAGSAYIVNMPQPSVVSLTTVSINTTRDVFVGLSTTSTTVAANGSLNAWSTSSLEGGEANAIFNIGRGANWRLDGIAGFRYIELDETLGLVSNVYENVTTATVFQPALGLPTGNVVSNQMVGLVTRSDFFQTYNSFYGGQIGLRGEYQLGRFFISLDEQVALGVMHQTVDINGYTSANLTNTVTPSSNTFLAGIPITTPTGAPAVTTKQSFTSHGGLFAQPSNIGNYSRNKFEVAPESIMKLNYRFTDRIIGSVGYDFLFLSSVAHPGDQIDTAINPTRLATPPSNITGPAQPSFQLHGSDYWTQGATFGLEFRF